MDFYVYIHRRKTDGQIFYVGKGQGQRAWDTVSRNKFWHNVVKKHEHIVEIVSHGLQEWYAFELESELIFLYGRSDLNLGPLVNMTDGGDGASGSVRSEELRLRMSFANQGNKNPMFGVKGKNNPRTGTKHKLSAIEQMSKNRKGKCLKENNPYSSATKIVFLDDTKKCFSTNREAAQFLGVCDSTMTKWKKGKVKIPPKYSVKRIEYGSTPTQPSNNIARTNTFCAQNNGQFGKTV